MAESVVDRFLESICAASLGAGDLFTDDVVLDATVPGWRFTQRGADRVTAQLDHWYRDPGAFEELERLVVPGGEVVRFLLTWVEGGIPHASHQTHLITVDGDKIGRDTVFCGGRWPASLLAEMEAAHAG